MPWMSDVQIDVTALEVRRALARSFRGEADPGPHAWRGTVGVGDATVAVDIEPRAGGGTIVHARARSIQCDAAPVRLARVVAGLGERSGHGAAHAAGAHDGDRRQVTALGRM